MTHAGSPRAIALVVEDDPDQRHLLAVLLEESEMRVLECESAEAAVCVLDRVGDDVRLLLTEVKLAGVMNGTVLAAQARRRFPDMNVIVTSGHARPKHLPADTKFMQKPWSALNVLREAERSVLA